MPHPTRDVPVWLVPHTHWDREWYEPFQRFRLRLVDLMDDVVARAQRDPGFRFTMDGQMAAVEDYLEVRPEERDAIRVLVERRQLAIGPWRVLMDEFLCSGETMIRNLEIGLREAQNLGPVMPIGYLPDMFGHCAQMPQILRLVGIDQAVVWRGVPVAVDHHEFWWEAPDGTGIRTEYLAGSYGNASDLFVDGAVEPVQVRARLRDRVAVQQPWFGDDDFLAMYGTDHAAPLPSLMDQIHALNADGTTAQIRLATLTDYLATTRAPQDHLRVVPGELRSHARANILPGVISVRWHLKEAMAATERLLARYAEPFAALWLPTQPAGYLDLAWRGVVDSSCHDSVTGCGVDETAVQVQARIAEAAHAAQAVRDRAAAVPAAASPAGSLVVSNPLPFERSDLVRWSGPVPEDWEGVVFVDGAGRRLVTQELARPERVLAAETLPADRLSRLMHRVHDQELFGLEVLGIDVDEAARQVTFHVGDRATAPLDAVREEERLATVARQSPPETPWRVVTLDEPRRIVAASVTAPPLGWTCLVPEADPPLKGSAEAEPPPTTLVSVGPAHLDNGLLSVRVRDDGTLSLEAADGTRLEGVGRLVDGGDCGDSYNYGPPARDHIVDAPTSVETTVAVAGGPLLGALRVRRRYDVPSHVVGAGSAAASRSDSTVSVEVEMRVELRAGEPFVRLELEWDNPARDHRLRLHVPLARPTEESHAQGQLAVVRRGLTAEAGPVGEEPVPTFPAERFVDAGGTGVLLTRTMEYEVLDSQRGQEIALTLLRSVGYLSRNVHPYRSEPAGPQMPTPEAQVVGPAMARLAVIPHAGDWTVGRLGDLAEAYLHPVHAVAAAGDSAAAPQLREGLSISGADLVALRSREHPWVEVRVVNSAPTASHATFGSTARPIQRAQRCDALGNPGPAVEVDEGLVRVPLRPWEIATLQLDLTKDDTR